MWQKWRRELLANVSQAVLDSLFQITVIAFWSWTISKVIISVLFTSVDVDHNMTVILFGDGMILGFQILLAGTLEKKGVTALEMLCVYACVWERENSKIQGQCSLVPA